MLWRLAAVVVLPFVVADDDEVVVHAKYDGEAQTHDVRTSDEAVEEIDFESSETYRIEHCVMLLDSGECKWGPRGELYVAASLSTDKSVKIEYRDHEDHFVKDDKREIIRQCRDNTKGFYSIRLAMPSGNYLQTSVPLAVLAAGAVNGFDFFDVSLNEAGTPVSLFYQIKSQKKKRVFIDTAAQGGRATVVPEPLLPVAQPGANQKVKEDGTPAPEEDNRSFFSKYWWAILIGVMLISSMTAEEPAQGQAGGGGGGGAKKAN